MPRPYNKLFTPANASTNYFANDVTGTTLALTQTATPDGLAHKVTILNNSATDHSGKTIALVGISSEGVSQSETITGPIANATVTSTYHYTSIVSVTYSSTVAPDTMDVSYSGSVAMQAFPLDYRSGTVYNDVILTGTGNYTLQYTGDLINQGATPPYNWLSDVGSALTGATSSQSDYFIPIPLAERLLINSYSNGATFLLQVSQKNF